LWTEIVDIFAIIYGNKSLLIIFCGFHNMDGTSGRYS
jgi:hypothetical protein